MVNKDKVEDLVAAIPDDPVQHSLTPTDYDIVPSFWNMNQASLEGIRRAKAIQNTRHGILASVPMICRADHCPFVATCYISSTERPNGGRCPIEIAAIIDRFEKYCKALAVTDEDVVDMGLIKELVDIEVQMLRADNKMALEGDFVEDVIAVVDNKGVPYYKKELTKATDYKDRLRKDRHRILQLLNSTRKDREAGNQQITDPSIMAATLMAKAQELERSGKLRTVIEIVDQVKVQEDDG